jgi:hypothetical protein
MDIEDDGMKTDEALTSPEAKGEWRAMEERRRPEDEA